MDEQYVASILPKECPPHVSRGVFKDYLDELGGHLAIYKRVSYQAPPQLMREMCPDDWDNRPRPRWAAECTCTSCNESWITAWVGGPLKSIAVMVGEDGIYYPVDHLDSPDIGPYMMELATNDGVICPVCGESATLTHVSHLKSGTTRRCAICSIDNVGQYTALLYWIAYRYVDVDACVYEDISPWWAFLLDESGKLICFHYARDGWKLSRNREDPFFKLYTSGDGGVYRQKRGGFVRREVPSLTGFTGEKTGLGEYVRQGGSLPLMYLRLWQRHPAIENLVNGGWSYLLQSMMDNAINWGHREVPTIVPMPLINWPSCRPHEMLSMDRAAYRRLDKSANDRRGYEWFNAWKSYLARGGKLDICQFDSHWCSFTSYGFGAMLDMMGMVPGLDIPQVDHYLRKQGIAPREARILADTWSMTRIMTGREVLSYEELWPRRLHDRHDQLTAMYQTEKNKNAHLMYLEGFRGIYERFHELQWSDGELDIILPKHNGELIHEGTVLRHCVGTYGASHVSGRSTIFFVRRHRRPERCYYTLAMNMQGIPKRSQLHGYGNERHGAHKEHTHRIPKKVLAFCARWESEVVRPWYQEQQRKLKEGRTA